MRKPRPTTLQDAIDEYLLASSQHSRETQRWYREKVTTFARWAETTDLADLSAFRASDIRRYLVWLESNPPRGHKLSSYTVHGHCQVIKSLFAFAEREGLIDENPIARLKNVRVDAKIIAVFSPPQVASLFAAARQTRHPLRDAAILAVLFDCGLRASELVTLRLEHTTLAQQGSYIRVVGKGRKEREIPLGGQSTLAVRRYLSRERPTCSQPQTFLARAAQPMAVRGLESLFERLGESANITGVRCSPHDCRHTFATNYLQAGGSIYSLSRSMGHSSVTVTEGYVKSLSQVDVRMLAHVDVLGRLLS